MLGQRLSESRLQGDPFVSSTQQSVRSTAAALDDMHIMSLAAQSDCNSAQHIKAMMDALEQVKFDQLRLKLQQEGLDLSVHSCFPRRYPVTGRPLYVFEDEPHKIKNANQGIQRQVIKSRPELHSLIATIKAHRMQFPGSPRTPQHCPNLLPKLELLAVAKSQPQFNTLATIIDGATDRQNVACAELAFTSRDFIHAVNAAGFPEIALTLFVLGHGYMAADLRGLLIMTRCGWFHERSLFCTKVSKDEAACCFDRKLSHDFHMFEMLRTLAR